ncbi:NADP-dependent oxidoreductase domain-containing protein 1 isoform X2 [Phascolarctos cinereus]|nr:NADP-dependent oxidoreductase domain-containing protein 1 isoform X2 [Phascolarctos cinereus]XP_020841835.1 NADP-dependent oxidoreductase domain-containing protein 1 isoform X2 [Phascolarctos cinereus]
METVDLMDNLKSLQFEQGVQEEETPWLFLQSRSRGLMIQACAHAAFFCRLLRALRKMDGSTSVSMLPSEEEEEDPYKKPSKRDLKVGIIGGGRLGKQLALVLLHWASIPAQSLHISTRRPETLNDLQKMGIQCFYHNCFLVEWANLVFLCCLPSQLPHICLEINTRLAKSCIVYSLVTAVPLPRLKQLLCHPTILRPQYQCAENYIDIWGSNEDIRSALQDPEIVQATSPYSTNGGITLNIRWLAAVFYAALNICTLREIPYQQGLKVLSDLCLSVHPQTCGKDKTNCPRFTVTDFVNQAFANTLNPSNVFPWFDLITVQLKETPFSQHLGKSVILQEHLTVLYSASFGISLSQETEEEKEGEEEEEAPGPQS